MKKLYQIHLPVRDWSIKYTFYKKCFLLLLINNAILKNSILKCVSEHVDACMGLILRTLYNWVLEQGDLSFRTENPFALPPHSYICTSLQYFLGFYSILFISAIKTKLTLWKPNDINVRFVKSLCIHKISPALIDKQKIAFPKFIIYL